MRVREEPIWRISTLALKFLFELSTLWCTSLGLGFWVVLWECVNYNTSLWSWIFLTALQSWTVAYSQTMLNPCVPILLKGCTKVFMYRASIHFFIFHSSSNITTWLARSPIVVHYLPLHLPVKLWSNLYINHGALHAYCLQLQNTQVMYKSVSWCCVYPFVLSPWFLVRFSSLDWIMP